MLAITARQHGDEGADGRVPNATIVIYLTDASSDIGGETFFPELDVRVTPRRGAALSFANVDAAGAPNAAVKHGVAPLSRHAASDRLVLQIPLRPPAAGARSAAGHRWEAYAEHVSGAKHMAHMGIMLVVLLGFGGYYLWDSLYGEPDALKVVGRAAMRVVGASVVETDGPDARM